MEQARLRTVAARGVQPAQPDAGQGQGASRTPHSLHSLHSPHAAHALQPTRALPSASTTQVSHGPHHAHSAHLPQGHRGHPAQPGAHHDLGNHRSARGTDAGQSHGHGHGHGHDHSHGQAWQVPASRGDHLVLMPGQMHFGGAAASVRTLLGSCVAVTLWHPTKRIGGMCHYLLPSRNRRAGDTHDGRYGDEALETMVQLLRKAGTEPTDYHAHLYGGADTMPDNSGLKFNVGERNIEQGFSLIDRHGFQIQGVDVGDDVPRSVHLVLATGEVEMRRSMGKAPAPVPLTPAPAPVRRKHHV
jgi:chemotaxis protein CheD